MLTLIIIVFIIGYAAIAFEHSKSSDLSKKQQFIILLSGILVLILVPEQEAVF